MEASLTASRDELQKQNEELAFENSTLQSELARLMEAMRHIKNMDLLN